MVNPDIGYRFERPKKDKEVCNKKDVKENDQKQHSGSLRENR